MNLKIITLGHYRTNNAYYVGWTPGIGSIAGSLDIRNDFLNQPINLSTGNLNRMRITQIVTGGLLLFPGGGTSAIPNNGLTRVAFNYNGNIPIATPASLLHAGDNTLSQGIRSWMDLGLLFTRGTDHGFFGTRQKDPTDLTGRSSQAGLAPGFNDRHDIVINFGDNASGPLGVGTDNLTFIFSDAQIPGNSNNTGPNFQSTNYGREILRMNGNGNVGVGPVFFDNAQPQNMLHINNNGRNAAFTQISNSGGTGQLFSDGFHIGIIGNGTAELKQKENRDMRFFTNNIQYAVIKSTGHFGINTNTPNNRLEINSVLGTDPTPSGLRFTNLLSTATPIANPGLGVLSVDQFGDVIYVTGATGGGGFGNLCPAPQNPLTGDFEIPLATNKYLFTGQSVINNTVQQDAVAIGYNCGVQLPPSKFSAIQQQIAPTTSETFAGHFKNNDVSGTISYFAINTPITAGVFGETKTNSTSFGALNIGGTFEANGAIQSIGVLGRITKTNPVVGSGRYAIGGAFISDSAVTNPLSGTVQNYGVYGYAAKSSINNYGVYGEVPLSNIPGNVANYAIYGTAPSALPGSLNPGTGSEYAGYFDGDVTVMGVFNFPSDVNLKQNIDTIPDAINIINQLKPKQFDYKLSQYPGMRLPGGTQYGLIAQDVQSILPEIVTNNNHPAKYDNAGNIVNPAVNYKGLEYQQLIPFLIRAVQQLSDQNHKLDSLITALTQSVNSCCSNTDTRATGIIGNQLDVELNDKDVITLSQNVPNPYAEQTTITYNVPEQYGFAQIIFKTVDGKIIKAVDITKKGKGQLNVFASDLSQGLYMYTLIVDGKVIDTKKMVKQ